MKSLIAIVGENGAGKSTVVKQLVDTLNPQVDYEVIKFSDVLIETLELWGIDKTRQNLQLLPQLMDKGYGQGSLTRAVANKINTSGALLLFADGVRWLSDEEMIRSYKRNFLVYITAHPETRYNRLKNRKEKMGEGSLTWEDFLKEDSAQNEIYIPQIGSRANYTIVNTGSLSELSDKIKELSQMIKNNF